MLSNNIKMLKFIPCFIVFVSFLSCQSPEIKNLDKLSELEKLFIVGKAKKVKSCSYKPLEEFGEIIKDTLLGCSECEIKGRTIECLTFDKNNIKRGSTIYRYNSDWDPLEIVTNWSSNDTISQLNKFDKFNNLIESCYKYNPDTILNYCSKFKYNESNVLIEEIQYKVDGLTTWRIEYIYDSVGFIKEKRNYMRDNSFSSSEDFKYDIRGNVIRRQEKWSFGTFDIEEMEYDSRNNLIKSLTYSVVYDQVKNLRESKKFFYEYDSNSNWVKRIDFKNVTPLRIEERIIIY
jgi:hypothetical protein